MDRIVKAFRNNSGVRVPNLPPKPTSTGSGGGGGSTGRVPIPGTGYKNVGEVLRSKLNEAETKLDNLGKQLQDAKAKGNSFQVTKIKGQMRQTRKFIKEAPKIYRKGRFVMKKLGEE